MKKSVRVLVVAISLAAAVGGVPATASASIANGILSQGLEYVATAPVRVLDTRDGTGSPVRANWAFYFDISGAVPPEAKAVVLNLTGTNVKNPTYVGVGGLGVSNLNLDRGATNANLVTVPVPAGGKIWIYDNNAGVDVIADLAGYYADTGSRFTPLAPARVLDTRAGTGTGGARSPVGAGQTITLDLAGKVPAGTSAAVFTLTGTDTTASTFVTAFPAGHARPLASNLNLAAGETRPNLVTVAVSADRKVELFNNAGSVHLVADLAGYYSGAGELYYPLEPFRAMDTRDAGTPVGPSSATVFDLSRRLPPTAKAVVYNLTGTASTQTTYVTAYPTGGARPVASNLNLGAGKTAPNLAITILGQRGSVDLFNNAGSVHLITDVAGYFAPPVPPCARGCVKTWGGDARTATEIPRLTEVVSVAAGAGASYALKSDGTVVAWGHGLGGRLGNGIMNGYATYPGAVSGLADVVSIAAGWYMGYAVKRDGSLWHWGQERSTPIYAYGVRDVVAVAADSSAGFALKSDGTVLHWMGGSSIRPQQMPGLSGITKIVAGDRKSYALKSDGTVWGWSTDDGSPVPAQVAGLTEVASLAAGATTDYAVRTDGTVWAWGSGTYGSLGNGGTTDSEVPVQVSGLTGVVSVEVRPVGHEQSIAAAFALKSDGTVWAWGWNWRGELGTGVTGVGCGETPTNPHCSEWVPVQVTGLGTVSALSAGRSGTYAVVPDP